jgi:hypothetical protein
LEERNKEYIRKNIRGEHERLMGKYLEGSGFGDAMREPCATYFFLRDLAVQKSHVRKGTKSVLKQKNMAL